jgi:hypothetical protein
MQVPVAMTYPGEIAAISKHGPDALREKVAALTDDQRALLREALAA